MATSTLPEGTTPIDVYLKNPNGLPLTNTRFLIRPVRAGWVVGYDGLIEDREMLYSTDENGYCQIGLLPLAYPYVLTYSYDDNAVPGYFMFFVPTSTTAVNLQDLIVIQTPGEVPYGEQVLAQIIAARVATEAAAATAAAAEEASSTSETNAKTSETNAKTSETNAAADRAQVALTNQNLIATYTSILEAITKIQAISLTNMLKLGDYYIWVDSSGRLRILNSKPTDKENDGVVVGTQS